MALRYIDTNFFKSPYVRSLKAPIKTLYIFIICDCSGAGIWVKDLDVASIYTGNTISEKDFKIFIDSGKAVDLGNGKYFFPDFIDHQYPSGFSEKNPAQKNFISELKKYNLLDADLKIIKTLQRPFKGSQVMVMVKEEVMEVGTVVVSEEEIEELKTDFDKIFDDFRKMRKAIKKPLTDEAEKLIIQKLKKLAPDNESLQIEILEQSIMNSYQGVFPLNEKTIQTKQTNYQPPSREETIGGIKKSELAKFASQ